MSAPALEPGVWVEVINSSGRHPPFLNGAVFEVEELISYFCCEVCDGCPGVQLRGVRRVPGGWASCCVRPIYRPRADLIERLLEPIRAPELEPA